MPRLCFSPRVPFRFISTLVFFFVIGTITPGTASAQFGGLTKSVDGALCAFGGLGLAKASQKVAQFEAQRLKLPPAAAAAQQHQWQTGMALALCNGGKLIANTVYANMTKRDQEARQKEMDAAVADTNSGTRNYAVPDHPDMKGTITTTPEVAEGGSECRTVEDHLAEGDKGDSALVKYCRKPPATEWTVSTGL